MNRTTPLFALFAVGCAPDFSAALVLTIEDSPLSAGGYQIDLRQPDGAAVLGVNETFVAFRAGDQEVTLLLNGEALFAGRDTAPARVNVWAVPGRNAGSVARGSVVVTLERHAIVDTSVQLRLDPRPLGATGTASYGLGPDGAKNALVTLVTTGLTTADPYVFDLWLTDGAAEREWAGRLDAGSLQFLPSAHGSFVAKAGYHLLVTAEPADSPQPLAGSTGWPLLAGELNLGLAQMLMGAPGAPGGYWSAADNVIDVVRQHKDFALAAVTTSEARGHCEHVVTGLAGEIAANAPDPNNGNRKLGDLNNNGTIEFVTSDRRGIGVDDASGYRGLMAQAFTELETLGGQLVLDANICRANFGIAVDDSLTTGITFAANPADGAAEANFGAAVDRIVGSPYDTSGDASQTLQCVLETLAQLAAALDLTEVAAGQD